MELIWLFHTGHLPQGIYIYLIHTNQGIIPARSETIGIISNYDAFDNVEIDYLPAALGKGRWPPG